MAPQIFDPEVTQMREAAEMAVFRLYGYLGAGVRLVKALGGLSGTQTFVASSYQGRMDIFRVSVLEHQPDEAIMLQVVHAPTYDSLHSLKSLPADTPGHWSVLLKAINTGGPFHLAALTVSGQDLDLNSTPQYCDSSTK